MKLFHFSFVLTLQIQSRQSRQTKTLSTWQRMKNQSQINLIFNLAHLFAIMLCLNGSDATYWLRCNLHILLLCNFFYINVTC